MAGDDKSRVLGEVEGVTIYARKRGEGKPPSIDATDRDREKVRRIADLLHGLGYGVMRESLRVEAKVYHTLDATWAGEGEPPENPIAGAG